MANRVIALHYITFNYSLELASYKLALASCAPHPPCAYAAVTTCCAWDSQCRGLMFRMAWRCQPLLALSILLALALRKVLQRKAQTQR
jgi:hypothetical protein